MAAEGSTRFFRLNGFDLSGRKIDPTVLAAAEIIYPRAFDHGVKLLGDPAVVTGALEEVAADVSRAIKAKDPPGDLVRDLKAYLFTAFLRHVNRLKHKELTLVSLSEVAHLPGPAWADPLQRLETKILLDECLVHFEFIDQDLAWRRMHGRSWREAGKVHGLSAHAAEARFSHALKQARKRLKI
jgi:DNA-directed RNA polymerase specialized sigma24 family protein